MNSDVRRTIMGERLRLLASMCQTLAVGTVLLSVVTPFLASDGSAEAGLSGDGVLAAGIAVLLLVTVHTLIGFAVRVEA